MLRLLAALVLTVALGLLSRLAPIGWPVYDKSLGDALYAVAAYLVLALVLHRWPVCRVAALALAACLAVEAFKFTGLPARYAGYGAVRWLLGTTPSWHNVACYALGIAAIAGADALLLRPGRGRRGRRGADGQVAGDETG
jgi:hypothetical protein